MTPVILIYGILQSFLLTFNYYPSQITSVPEAEISQKAGIGDIAPAYMTVFSDVEKQSYRQAYTDFLLNTNIDKVEDADFATRGFYLFDLNFDKVPELGVWHDSGGSMGGYFTLYCFDGKGITAIRNEANKPARISDYTQIFADNVNKKVYFLKEMYLLRGNTNGTDGYLREVLTRNDLPYVQDILSLEVNQDANLEQYYDRIADYECENDYLSDPELGGCLITQYYSGNEWKIISSVEYLKLKLERIPKNNDYVDLRDTTARFLYPTDGIDEGKPPTRKDIDLLFSNEGYDE